MTDRPPRGPHADQDRIEIDGAVAHTSRIYDYLLGGTDNFAVDREVAEHAFAPYPGGVDGARTDARANRAFLGRAVRYLAGEAGIRQFLDIGTGIPTVGNTHEVVRQAAPGARVVYVDNDPIVLAHAHSLLSGGPSGGTRYVDGDLRHPERLLLQAATTLDLAEPVAIVLVGILHVIPDEEKPHEIVATMLDAVAPGSHLAVSHMANDVQAREMAEVQDRLDVRMHDSNPPAFRSRDEVARFLDGLDLVEPGVVQVDRWRPDGAAPGASGGSRPSGARVPPLYVAVGRKS